MTDEAEREPGISVDELFERMRPKLAQADAEWHARGAVGQQLLLARTRAELSQALLAERSGVRQSDISEIENGLGNPTKKTLEKLGVALGIDFVIGASSAA